jgi:hypothetical protein
MANDRIDTLARVEMAFETFRNDVRNAEAVVKAEEGYSTNAATLILRIREEDQKPFYRIYMFSKENTLDRLTYRGASTEQMDRRLLLGSDIQGLHFLYNNQQPENARIVTMNINFKKGTLRSGMEARFAVACTLRN